MIRLDHRDGIARLTINRGGARNAFDLAGWRSVSDAVARIDLDTRAVILCSADPTSFSAGADISEIAANRLASGWPERFLSEMRAAIDSLAALPMPVIAAIDGSCFGAGVALALAADVRIAGESARFAVTPAKLGLLYPAIDVQRLIAAIGTGQASRMLMTGDVVNAVEAARIGLIEQVVPNATDTAAGMAARIAANAPGAIAGLKATLRNPDPATQDVAFLAALIGKELGSGLADFASRKGRA
ncbi:enoyl-CoA hydratase/isomerase family protein [Sphingomonas sp. AX6]|uniref:enoyl-CoA hydratase/isomerase family protein n=1 Tax=Sphingomonas sp. AX6 TaxID=2653171 RepID=UPI0012EEEFF5|nr:enoyl-CoA hydratase/isomerase family protein [Sphingomonas sp. AX6]VXC94771.1 Enoyl-CoA hydratase [Sphingomonas sp. AX6]